MARMTNGDYQQRRIEADSSSLISQLARVIENYGMEIDGDPVSQQGYANAIRDVLTDLRHICDINELNFGDIDAKAYMGYTEELTWREDENDAAYVDAGGDSI